MRLARKKGAAESFLFSSIFCRELAALRVLYPGVPFSALTATATATMRDAITDALRLGQPTVIVSCWNNTPPPQPCTASSFPTLL